MWVRILIVLHVYFLVLYHLLSIKSHKLCSIVAGSYSSIMIVLRTDLDTGRRIHVQIYKNNGNTET